MPSTRHRPASEETVTISGTVTITPADGATFDVSDRWTRELGQIDLARVLGATLTVVNPVIVGVYDALGNRMPAMDAATRPGYVDVIDRWARTLGQFDLARVLGNPLTAANPVITGIYDATTGARVEVLDAVSDVDPDLDERSLLGTHALLSAREDNDTTIGLHALNGASFHALYTALTDGTDVAVILAAGADNVANTVDQLVTASMTYGYDISGTWDRIISRLANSDSDPDLDGLSLLGVHALLSARYEDTTIGLTALDGTYNALHVAITDGTEVASVDASNRLETAPTQTTRTSLTVMGEREDLIIYSQVINEAGGANVVSIIAATASQYIKVYSLNYFINEAVQVGFRFGAGSNFAMRNTAGTYAQTYTHPMVGPVNTALNFVVAGNCTGEVTVQYVKEA